MKKIVVSIVTVLALGLGLATDRVQKSSLIVTPEGWRSASNVSNSTMIMGRNGSKLIGFNSSSSSSSSICGPESNHTAAGGEVDPEQSGSGRRPVIGFDQIPVVDLNGTLHLLSDEIIPVTTISGDIIYTTQQALSPLNNNNSNSTNIARAPLDKYRQQRADPQRKADKNLASTDPGKQMRSGSGSTMSSSQMMMMMMMSDPLIQSGSGSNTTNTTTTSTSSTSPSSPSSSSIPTSPNASGKSPINLYASNKKDMLSSSSSRGSPSNQSPRTNDIPSSSSSSSSSSKTFDNLPSSSKALNNDPSSSSKGLNDNKMRSSTSTDPMNNNPARDRPDSAGGLTPPSRSGGLPASSASNVDPMDDFLNDVLSPILSSTSLWKAGPTGPSSSSDMVLIPVETNDLFQGSDLIIETDDPQDTILIADPASWLAAAAGAPSSSAYDPAGPGMGQQQLQQSNKIQDPSTMRSSSSSRSQNQQSSSSSSSSDQDSLPIGIISPELLQQNMDPGTIPSSTKPSGPKQYGTGRPFPANELQSPVRLPVGVASPEQLKMQEQEDEDEEGEDDDDNDSGSGSGSGSRSGQDDPTSMKDGGVVLMMMMGMTSSSENLDDDPSRLMSSPDQNQEDPKDDLVLIMNPIVPGPGGLGSVGGPGGPAAVQRPAAAGPGRSGSVSSSSSSSRSMKMMDGDECEPVMIIVS